MRPGRGGWTYTVVQFLRVALLVSVLIVPAVAGDFWRFFCFQMVVAAYLAVSFDLTYSYGRILSFAQGIFFAIGAYAAIILATAAPWGFALVVFGAIACGMLVGAAIGVVLVRMEGHNPTIATVILASIGLLAANALSRYTGGEDGLSLATQSVGVGAFQLRAGPGLAMYYTAAGPLLTLVIGQWALQGRRTWKVLRAVARNETRAQLLGFNTRLRRWVVFTLSAGVAALGGAFYVLLMKHVTTSVLDIGLSVDAILWAVVGGVGTAFGPLLGVFVVYPVTQMIASVFIYVQILVGLLLVIVAVFFPHGIIGTLREAARLQAQKARPLRDAASGPD